MIGVLVLAYGGPNNLEEVEPYLLDVRGYRPTSIDTVYQNLAKSLNIHLERIEMLNTAPTMINGLAQLICEKAKEAGWL